MRQEAISVPKQTLIAHSCSSRVKPGSSLRSGNEPEPGRMWAKEGDSHPHAIPCPPEGAPLAGESKGPTVGLAVLERPEAPGGHSTLH